MDPIVSNGFVHEPDDWIDPCNFFADAFEIVGGPRDGP
jgi:hypothetical protein